MCVAIARRTCPGVEVSSGLPQAEGRLRAHLRDSYAAYNRAYRHRLDPGGEALLSQARLDLLLALAQADEPLTPELLEQTAADASLLWHLDDEPEGRPSRRPAAS